MRILNQSQLEPTHRIYEVNTAWTRAGTWYHQLRWFSHEKPSFLIQNRTVCPWEWWYDSPLDSMGMYDDIWNSISSWILSWPWTTPLLPQACHQHHLDPSFLCIQRSSERRVQAGGAINHKRWWWRPVATVVLQVCIQRGRGMYSMLHNPIMVKPINKHSLLDTRPVGSLIFPLKASVSAKGFSSSPCLMTPEGHRQSHKGSFWFFNLWVDS